VGCGFERYRKTPPLRVNTCCPIRRGASCRGASRNCFILWSFPVGANLSFCERFHRNCLCIVVCRRLGVGATPFRCGDALCMSVSFVVMCGVLFNRFQEAMLFWLKLFAAGTGMHPLFRCGVAKLVNDPAFPQFDVARVALIR
jgi:hypothetical protein